MKKYLLYVCVCILLFSCKKQPQSNNLIGKWESYRIEIYNYEHDPSKPIMINEDTRAIYIFDIDGKYDDGGIKGNYTVSGSEITVYSQNHTIDMKYVFIGNNLILEYKIDDYTSKVFLNRIK